MKLLMINHEFPPVGGGAATITRELFERFDNSNHEVHLLTTNTPSAKINIHSINTRRKSDSTGSIIQFILFFIMGLFRLKKIKEQVNPDIVFAFFSIPGGLLAYANKKIHKIPYIVSIRGGDIPGFQLGLNHQMMQRLAQPVIKMVCKHADLVHVNSHRLKYLTLKIGIDERKIHYLPNGINIENYNFRENRVKNRLKILFTGRLSNQKNLLVFLKALSMIEYDYRFKIVGEGPKKKKLYRFVKKNNMLDKVTFINWTKRRILKNFYNEYNILILPSLDEGMSNSALEAVGRQCLLLSSKNAHLQWQDDELMENWVVDDYRNPLAWEKSLDRIFENLEELDNTSRKMKKYIILNNDWNILFDKYKNMVEKCVV